jgi:hypothetical protein
MNYKKIALVPLFLGLLGSICSCFPTTNSNPTSNSVTTSHPTSQPTSDVPTTGETPTTNQTTTSSDPTTSKPTTSSEEISNEEEIKLNEFNDKYSMKDFFGYENKIKVEINMDKNELYQLSEDYDAYPHHSSPIYRICDVTFTINEDVVTLSKVGIRLKGNTSRRKFVDEDGNVYATVHFKLDFNEMIDYVDYSDIEKSYIDERKFLGLKKLDLKWNKNYDTSHIKEYVALELYKERVKMYEGVMNSPYTHEVLIKNLKGAYGKNFLLSHKIVLEKRMIHFSLEIIDQTIIHEICHDFEGNHSSRFYNILKAYCPHYKELKEKLSLGERR